MIFPVGSRAAWMATIGSFVFAASQAPTSAGAPTSAAASAAVANLGSGSTCSPPPDCSSLAARRISACSRACSGPSVAVSKARSSRLAHSRDAQVAGVVVRRRDVGRQLSRPLLRPGRVGRAAEQRHEGAGGDQTEDSHDQRERRAGALQNGAVQDLQPRTDRSRAPPIRG